MFPIVSKNACQKFYDVNILYMNYNSTPINVTKYTSIFLETHGNKMETQKYAHLNVLHVRSKMILYICLLIKNDIK